MDTRNCSMCNIEKHINKFYKNYSECKDCNRGRELERYYGIKKNIETKYIYFEKNR